jgi:N-methylhydantoinase A
MFRVGCDIGGTFTDFVLLDESTGEIFVEKGLTTPADPSIEIMTGLAALDRIARGYAAHARFVAHATTLIANAVIERKGARTALLATRGFRDVLELRRHVRVTTYELWADPPEPLVPRFLRVPVAERTAGDGRVITPVDRGEIEAIAHRLRSDGVESVAVAFLHAYANPTNELEAARLLGELAPEIAVTASSSVLPQIKEFERTSGAVVNAYVKPLARRYLLKLDGGIRGLGFTAPLRIMLSTGGVASAETAGEFPVRLIESGPVAGAIVAQYYASLGGVGATDVLSFDMGGTTAKACLVREHELPITDELEVARSRRFMKSSGYPVPVPAVDLMEIGAGGGSIASVNALGLVQVGPESAGADPGPICYARGGKRSTVTDADLVLGYLNPEYFAGGTIRLDAGGASHGIERDVARPLGRDLVAAAWTVHDVVNETMAAAVRMHVTERGGNPERATLFAFGGAGPVHAYHLAAALGIPRLIVPLRAGVLSALGLVIAPVSFDLVRTHKLALGQLNPSTVDAIFRDMSEEVRQTLDKAQPGAAPTFTRAVDIGYIGQGYQVTVPVDESTTLDPSELWRRFAAVYRDKYGYFYDDVPAELVNLRVSGRLAGMDVTLPRLDVTRPASAAPKDERPAYSRRRGRMIPFAVYDRSDLGTGMSMRGPAIIEEASATTIVDDGGSASVDDWGSLVVVVSVVRDGGAS